VIVGSLSNSAAGALQLRLSTALAAIAVIGVAIALTAGPRLYHRGELATLQGAPTQSPPVRGAATQSAPVQEAPVQSAFAAIPWRPLVLIGIAVMLMYISDSATSNWSAKYVEDVLHGAKSVGPLGLAAYATCQVLGRLLVADRAVHRFGPVRPVAVGGALGLVGMSLVAVAPAPGLAIAGFAIAGFGLCVVVPQSFSAAGALDPTGSGVAIARVNLFNYIGFILGAGLIGAVDQALGLRWAFAVPAVLCLGIIALARFFRVATIGLGDRAAGTTPNAPGSAIGTDAASRDAAARAIADR
jgi:sugar phosphate permease